MHVVEGEAKPGVSISPTLKVQPTRGTDRLPPLKTGTIDVGTWWTRAHNRRLYTTVSTLRYRQ